MNSDIQKEAWNLFRETGDIYAYMAYRDMKDGYKKTDGNAYQNRRNSNTGAERRGKRQDNNPSYT